MSFLSDRISSVRSLAGSFGLSAATPATAENEAFYGQAQEGRALSAEAQALFDVKQDILNQVRANTLQGERPTLEQYRLACENFAGTEQGQAMVARGEWNSKVAADLSGQDLSGFTISEPKKAATQEHHLEAPQPATEQTHGHRIASAIDMYNRDGNGEVNVAAAHEFYDNIRFDKADLHGAWVEPATSFNEEIAQAGNLKNLTFSGMNEGDEFTFGAGKYENATLRDVQGGKVIFGENTQVTGVVLDGKSCHIEMKDHSYISNITPAEGFRIIDLQMGANATLAHSNLGESTISMSSHFEPGASFQSVNFGRNVDGLDLSGLKLVNCSIDGKPISHASQLAEYGITHDASTVATASPDMMQKYELAQIRATMQNAMGSITPSANGPGVGAGPQNELDAIREKMQGAVATIGNPLNENEKANLDAIRATNEARQQQTRDATSQLPGGTR